MSTLLRVDSSPLKGDASFSRQLTAEFVQHWQASHPGGRIITRDLVATTLPPVSAEWIGAAYSPAASRTQPQQEILAISDELIAELEAADEYVFGVAMHNFSIPSVLKLWIDQVVRVGKTFSYENGVIAGRLRDKKATFLVASGGVYEPGTPAAGMNFVEPYLRPVFGTIGVRDTSFINAGGTAQVRFGVNRDTILQPALQSIRTQLQQAQVA
ncbi:MAG: NAD(P)H-dependent oxidoreductase [Bryobacteraceae bacterium]|jgi:FMN-dependent NADH-azoreductase